MGTRIREKDKALAYKDSAGVEWHFEPGTFERYTCKQCYLGLVLTVDCRHHILGSLDDISEKSSQIPAGQRTLAIIESMPSFLHSLKKDECLICHLDLEEGVLVRALACSHKFHAKCIRVWLERKLVCPLCKVGVTLQEK
jgi:hypothetical protein